MPSTLRHGLMAGAAACLLCAPLAAARAEPRATLSTDIPAIVASHAATAVAAPAPDRLMHLAVSLPLRNTAELDALIAAVTDPDSPDFRHYITPTEFAARFGPLAADYQAAADWFRAQGLAVTAPAENGHIIDVDGKLADIERVFHVTFGLYRHPTEARLFTAPDRAPTLDLNVRVEQVIGLDDFVLPHAKLIHTDDAAMQTRGGTGPSGNFDGHDMRKAYYPSGTLNGEGQSIALFEFAGVNFPDVQSFFTKNYGAADKVDVVLIKTDSEPLNCTKGGGCKDDSEQALDIEYAISLAPHLSSVRVYIGNIAEDILKKIATDNISKIISSSWGWGEKRATDDAIFKQYQVQGQTNLTASGDDSSLTASGPWPEESAYIIGVGGTDVSTDSHGLWSKETGWIDSAGGPSTDHDILIEPYQKRVLVSGSGASHTYRNVPDVALNANFGMVICANGKVLTGYGGTSFASPMWAGIVAMADQKAKADKKKPVGWINPVLYKLSASSDHAKLFHDITSGRSGLYHAGKGYDLVTGIGSPIGQAFIDALVSP